MRLLLPLLALALAGCAAAPAGAPDAAATPGVLPWSLTECRYLVGWSPADPAKLQARLPEGFTIARGTLPGGVRSPAASLGTEVFECARGSGLEGEVEAMAYGSIWYTVEPPEALRVDGVDLYMMKEHILVPDAPRREHLAARGVSVHDGGIAWTAARAPAGSAGVLELDGFGAFTLALEVPREMPSPEGDFAFIEFTPDGRGGLARWYASYAWDSATFSTGRGTIAWPAGTWAADAVGAAAAAAPADFHMGTWSFAGNVTLPAP